MITRRTGFTLVEVLVVVAAVAILAAIAIPVYQSSVQAAKVQSCFSNLRQLSTICDRYMVEHGRYPPTLEEAVKEFGGSEKLLHCPCAPDSDSHTYSDFYVRRWRYDPETKFWMACPYHRGHAKGLQMMLGNDAMRQESVEAELTEVAGTVKILRLEEDTWVEATAGTKLFPGDSVKTEGEGSRAMVHFADASTGELLDDCEVRLIDSFRYRIEGVTLYTVVRLKIGELLSKVTPGSKYEVATPTATIGAKGTQFSILVHEDGETEVHVLQGEVYVTGDLGDRVDVQAPDVVIAPLLKRLTSAVATGWDPNDPDDSTTNSKLQKWLKQWQKWIQKHSKRTKYQVHHYQWSWWWWWPTQ